MAKFLGFTHTSYHRILRPKRFLTVSQPLASLHVWHSVSVRSQSTLPFQSPRGLEWTIVGSLAAAGLLLLSTSSSWTTYLQQSQPNDDGTEMSPLSFQIEVNFVDKMAGKSYVQGARGDGRTGLPDNLRLLVVDLPEVAQRGISGGPCRVALDRVYPDGIVPPKVVHHKSKGTDKKNAHHTKKGVLHVEQKAWVQSMVECVHADNPDKVGVQIMQANTTNLNPTNLRRAVMFGNYRYDPGKYSSALNSSSADTNESLPPPTVVDEPTVEDELNAPWNQYAWSEELVLRVTGKIPFGAALAPAQSWWTRRVSGMLFEPERRFDMAAEKPHAVIANAAALHRVPHALRLLQSACQQADVPLFVLGDVRHKWTGGITHGELADCLRAVRKKVKRQWIEEALHGAAFARGRHVGRMEREMKWQAKEVIRTTREQMDAIQEALKRKREMDWRQLDETALQEKLIKTGVVKKKRDGGLAFSDSLRRIAERCLPEKKSSPATETQAETPKLPQELS